MNPLKIGMPKGSLQASTIELFRKAGIKVFVDDRSYRPSCSDKELCITLVRAQEIPIYVERGIFDCGITGYDWILETDSKVREICELVYAKSGYRAVKWVIAVPENSDIKTEKDLNGKSIATELVSFVKRYLNSKRIKADVEFSWGATEIKAPDLVDAIVELTETGSSLRANNLRVIGEILRSTTRLIANNAVYAKDKFKKEKIDNLAILLKGALAAEDMVGLKMNIRQKGLSKIMGILPALKKPTVSQLTLPGWVALEVILNEDTVKEIIPRLKKAGAEGIIEYPLNKVIL